MRHAGYLYYTRGKMTDFTIFHNKATARAVGSFDKRKSLFGAHICAVESETARRKKSPSVPDGKLELRTCNCKLD